MISAEYDLGHNEGKQCYILSLHGFLILFDTLIFNQSK